MKRIRVRDVPRERDEEVLRWLASRVRGVSTYAIAKRAGVTGASVVDATNKVRDDDRIFSGEPESVVAEGYW